MLVLGHRGAPDLAHENTIESYEAAMAAGADGVEIDVRLTCDGHPVLFHDKGVVNQLTLAQVRRRLPWVPTFTEGLAALRDLDCVVDLEVKELHGAEQVVRQARQILGPEKLVVTSFVFEGLLASRHVAPDVSRGLLIGGPSHHALARDDDTPWARMEACDAEYLVCEHVLLDTVGRHAAAHGRKLWTWNGRGEKDGLAMTVSSAEQMSVSRDFGAAAAIVDAPEIALA